MGRGRKPQHQHRTTWNGIAWTSKSVVVSQSPRTTRHTRSSIRSDFNWILFQPQILDGVSNWRLAVKPKMEKEDVFSIENFVWLFAQNFRVYDFGFYDLFTSVVLFVRPGVRWIGKQLLTHETRWRNIRIRMSTINTNDLQISHNNNDDDQQQNRRIYLRYVLRLTAHVRIRVIVRNERIYSIYLSHIRVISRRQPEHPMTLEVILCRNSQIHYKFVYWFVWLRSQTIAIIIARVMKLIAEANDKLLSGKRRRWSWERERIWSCFYSSTEQFALFLPPFAIFRVICRFNEFALWTGTDTHTHSHMCVVTTWLRARNSSIYFHRLTPSRQDYYFTNKHICYSNANVKWRAFYLWSISTLCHGWQRRRRQRQQSVDCLVCRLSWNVNYDSVATNYTGTRPRQ